MSVTGDPIRDRRVQYETAGLDVADVDPDPFEQWRRWHADALAVGVAEPNAMVLATVDGDGQPSARAVLVRGVDHGFVFFTNYDSPKSRELTSNPRVAATFLWTDLHRQVRLRGRAERIADAESDAYFAGRPRGSQLGAWASPQSTVIADRAELDRSVASAEARYPEGTAVPRPPNWGGWRVRPDEFEFWQGRPSRLHDRLRYLPAGTAGAWSVARLAP